MNNQWTAFLESRAARIDDEGEVRFPDAPAEADCALMDLSDLGLIAVSGPEAEGFLQGQITSDLTQVSDTQTQLGSHCSPKGRMLASFRLFKLNDEIFLQLPRSRVEATVQRLRMYLLRTKATIEDASERLVTIAVAGECAPSLLASRLDAVPEKDNALARNGDLTIIRVPGPVPRFQILGPAGAIEATWDHLAATATILNSDFWALLDIRAGIPSVYPQTIEAFVPQMTNLQLIEGVSFKKGCYTGQEVVARMQYLGKLKRRMYLARTSTGQPPMPGDELHCPTSSSAQATGWVVDARVNRDGDCELLVVVEIGATQTGEVRLGDANGPLLSFSDPPYGFASEA